LAGHSASARLYGARAHGAPLQNGVRYGYGWFRCEIGGRRRTELLALLGAIIEAVAE